MKKRTKEEIYIENLKKRLNPLYNSIETRMQYPKGEIDVVGISEGRRDLYEVKATDCSRNLQKAKEQLQRAQEKISDVGRCYVYIGNSDEIIPI